MIQKFTAQVTEYWPDESSDELRPAYRVVEYSNDEYPFVELYRNVPEIVEGGDAERGPCAYVEHRGWELVEFGLGNCNVQGDDYEAFHKNFEEYIKYAELSVSPN